jgi:hypothetical protein
MRMAWNRYKKKRPRCEIAQACVTVPNVNEYVVKDSVKDSAWGASDQTKSDLVPLPVQAAPGTRLP